MLHGYAGGFSVGTLAPLMLTAAGLFIVLLAETCRIPVDDPNTHLELTMIHEVMVLDHSGPLLGAALYAAAMKLFVLGAFLLHIVAPFGTDTVWLDWLIFIAEMLALAAAIGVVESIMARLRMKRVSYLLVSAVLLCGSAFILTARV
jgi:formate hydrogenlyase subunit 4